MLFFRHTCSTDNLYTCHACKKSPAIHVCQLGTLGTLIFNSRKHWTARFRILAKLLSKNEIYGGLNYCSELWTWCPFEMISQTLMAACPNGNSCTLPNIKVTPQKFQSFYNLTWGGMRHTAVNHLQLQVADKGCSTIKSKMITDEWAETQTPL